MNKELNKNLPPLEIEFDDEFTGDKFGVDVENVISGVGSIIYMVKNGEKSRYQNVKERM